MNDSSYRKQWLIFEILKFDTLTKKIVFLCCSIATENNRSKHLIGTAQLNQTPPLKFFNRLSQFYLPVFEQLGYFVGNQIYFPTEKLIGDTNSLHSIHLRKPEPHQISQTLNAKILKKKATNAHSEEDIFLKAIYELERDK